MYTNAELFVMASNPDTSKEVFLSNVTLSIPDDAPGFVDLDATKAKLEKIWDVAHMPFGDMVKAAHLSKTNFAKRAGLPLNTLNNWCRGERAAPVYVKFLLAEHYGFI